VGVFHLLQREHIQKVMVSKMLHHFCINLQLAGAVLSPPEDSHSYAMEHDASRLNYLLLWQVLERRSPEPSWSKWVPERHADMQMPMP